jgi:hypothetical protein
MKPINNTSDYTRTVQFELRDVIQLLLSNGQDAGWLKPGEAAIYADIGPGFCKKSIGIFTLILKGQAK